MSAGDDDEYSVPRASASSVSFDPMAAGARDANLRLWWIAVSSVVTLFSLVVLGNSEPPLNIVGMLLFVHLVAVVPFLYAFHVCTFGEIEVSQYSVPKVIPGVLSFDPTVSKFSTAALGGRDGDGKCTRCFVLLQKFFYRVEPFMDFEHRLCRKCMLQSRVKKDLSCWAKLKTGGTMEINLRRGHDLRQFYQCTRCTMLMRKKGYVHQCLREQHLLCGKCLREMRRCSKCIRPYTNILKSGALDRQMKCSIS